MNRGARENHSGHTREPARASPRDTARERPQVTARANLQTSVQTDTRTAREPPELPRAAGAAPGGLVAPYSAFSGAGDASAGADSEASGAVTVTFA